MNPFDDKTDAYIQLSGGKLAMVSKCDHKTVKDITWSAAWHPQTSGYYAIGHYKPVNGKRTTVRMSRVIMGAKVGLVVDHINHDTLDNRRDNLRVVTVAQNNMNKKGPNKKSVSGLRGVSWNGKNKKWRSQIQFRRKSIYLGDYADKRDAAHAYEGARRKYFGIYGG